MKRPRRRRFVCCPARGERRFVMVNQFDQSQHLAATVTDGSGKRPSLRGATDTRLSVSAIHLARSTSVSDRHPSSTWTTYLRNHERPPVDPDAFAELMRHPSYPRASAYDPAWVRNNSMGPKCSVARRRPHRSSRSAAGATRPRPRLRYRDDFDLPRTGVRRARARRRLVDPARRQPRWNTRSGCREQRRAHPSRSARFAIRAGLLRRDRER